MQCRKCGTGLEGADYKMVAEWPFCGNCFQALMDGAARKAPAPAPKPIVPDRAETSVQVVIKPAGRLCSLCETELPGDPYARLGPFSLCADCVGVLADSEPDSEPEPESDEVAENETAPEPPSVGFMSRVACAGCGRMVPAGGAKEASGKLYCPDCYHRLPEELRRPAAATTTAKKAEDATGASGSEVSADEADEATFAADSEAAPSADDSEAATTADGAEIATSPEDTEPSTEAPIQVSAQTADGATGSEPAEGCEGCGKRVPGQRLQLVEGFSICAACESSDPKLAVELARARHLQRLQRLKRELGLA